MARAAYRTPELANDLKIELGDLMALIAQGKLQAIRIGDSIRIPEREVEKLLVTCAAVRLPNDLATGPSDNKLEILPEGLRWCPTRTGRARFKVRGSIATGAEIWPGQMRYPIKFSRDFMRKMLAHFRTGEIPIGGKFDDPGRGSLGEFIQHELKIKMNPAVYVAALLIDEGYADCPRRGYIRLTGTV